MTQAPQEGTGAPASGWLVDFLLLSAIWGSSFLFMRFAVVEFGALPTAAMRVAVAAAFLLPLLLWRKQGGELLRHWKPIFLIGVFNSALPFALFCFALLSISTGLSSILNATVPLFGALVAWLWLKDRPAPLQLLGLAVGFAGVALLAGDKAGFRVDTSTHPGWAVLACLGATLSYGVAATAAKRYLGGLPALVTATGSQLGAVLVLALPAAALWPAQLPGARAWLSLLVVGVLCTGVAYVLYFRLIARAGPARAVAVTFLVPVFATFYGVLFLQETVTAGMVACGLAIAAGTALSAGLIRPSRQARQE